MTVFCAKTETFAGTLDLKVPVNAVEDEVFEEGRVCCGNGQNTEWTTWAGRRDEQARAILSPIQRP